MDTKEDEEARTNPVTLPTMEEAVSAASGISASSSRGKDVDLDDMFNHLELNEEELDDVMIRVDEAKVYQQAARWLAIGVVHTSRTFSSPGGEDESRMESVP
jgi:hypothetical protein